MAANQRSARISVFVELVAPRACANNLVWLDEEVPYSSVMIASSAVAMINAVIFRDSPVNDVCHRVRVQQLDRFQRFDLGAATVDLT